MVRWKKALLVWLLIVFAETVSGTLRAVFIAPRLGDMQARQLGVLLGSLIILAIAVLTVRWFAPRASSFQLLSVGTVWVSLTIAFEITLGLSLGYTQERLWSDCDLSQGGLLGIGMLLMAVSPLLSARFGSTLGSEVE